MYVEVEHTPEDFLALGSWCAFRYRPQRVMLMVMSAVFAAIGLSITAPSGSFSLVVAGVVVGALIGAGLTFRTSRRMPLNAARLMHDRGPLALPTLYEVTPEGIGDRTRASRSFIAWWAVEGVGRTSKHLFVLAAPVYGYIIPARAFATENEWVRFADYVEEQYERARGSIRA